MKQIIFCDLDGTLLPAGKAAPSTEVLSHIKRITDKGMLFCVASGRGYDELAPLFRHIYRNIIFICLDGALTMYRDCVLFKKPMTDAAKLINGRKATVFFRRDRLEIEDGISTDNCRLALNRHGGEPLKIALYGSPAQTDNARCCYEKNGIFEYVAQNADKGSAATAVADKFCCGKNAAALGDGENDVPLLRSVQFPFRMDQCHPSLLDFGFPTVKTAEEFLSKF